MSYGLSKKDIDLIQSVFTQNKQIKQVKMYGSRAMGNYRKGSDIDLAFYTGDEHDISATLKEALELLPTPYLFDVTHYDTLTHQGLKQHIDTYGTVFYKISSET